MTQNFYQELGLTDTATAEEIKSSYRKLAKQYHPDLNQGDAQAETKFKAVSEAYNTLSDPQKKNEYDQQLKWGANAFNNNAYTQTWGNGPNPEDLLREFLNQNGAFGSMFGQGFRSAPAKNQDFVFSLTITFEEAYLGKQVEIQFDRPDNKDTKLNVVIPAGIDNGEQIKFNGLGDTQNSELPPGDLYVRILVEPSPEFHRQGPHLYKELTINAVQAMMGCELELTCMDRSNILVKVPAGTQDKSMLRIRSKGMPLRGNALVHGDLLIQISVVIPKLNKIQTELCQQLLDNMEAS